jgi:hypothetical protein
MNALIETKRTKDKLLISVSTENMKADDIEDFLQFVKTEFTLRNSKLSESQADEISEEIKSSWWKKNKSRIEKMIAEDE